MQVQKHSRTIIFRSDAHTKLKTRRTVLIVAAVMAFLAAGALLWSLRPIIFPFIVGMFTAYICFPLLNLFMRIRIPRPAGILILFGAFFLAIIVIANQVRTIIPDEREQIILRTSFQYKLNERYQNFMGIGKPEDKGNIIYKYFGKDFDRFMESINAVLRLNKDERVLFRKYREGYQNQSLINDQYFEYFLKNTESDREEDKNRHSRLHNGLKEEKKTDGLNEQSHIAMVMEAFKLWIIMPLVFLFLLIDDGSIKRFFVNLVPNRYFEVSLVVFDKVNRAIGNYLRGILIECSLVGLSYIILFFIIGFELKFAILIGLIAGIANAIPLLAPAVALIMGLAYAFIAENVNSILPFITPDNLIIAVALCVLIVMILDNVVFQPFVVGGAVQLHPLVVFIGIIGGSMLFGFAGLILAVPAIVVLKEFVFTLFRELKEYSII
jgi:predicted PurR-regulated permease PerM